MAKLATVSYLMGLGCQQTQVAKVPLVLFSQKYKTKQSKQTKKNLTELR